MEKGFFGKIAELINGKDGCCFMSLFIVVLLLSNRCVACDEMLLNSLYAGETVLNECNLRQDTIGDIYDRNGILVATGNAKRLKKLVADSVYINMGIQVGVPKKLKRYYPFGDHLFFMLGDLNCGCNMSNRGYMAEYRYKDYLKGNKNKKDMYLTVDAQLQTEIQKRMVEYIPRLYTHYRSAGKWVERRKGSKALQWKNKARASVVILDANKGDLLASANYPMLDMDRLKEESEKRNYYTDNRTDTAWRAYVDMDLGLLYPTAPSSTAMVITSIAALKAENITGDNLSKQKYFIHGNEKIMRRGEPDGNVDWRMALRESSNCYFINLVNDKELYDEMASVYGLLGLSISTERHPIKPAYTIDYAAADNEWIDNVLANTDNSIKEYQKYTEKDKKGNYILPRKQMNKAVVTNADIPSEEWAWSWGQGGVIATPLVMARAASIAVNDGNMAKTRFLMDEAVEHINVIDSEEAYSLKENMIFTARGHDKIRRANVGGKTGTPERGWIHPDPKFKTEADSILKPYDAWYMCFVEGVQVPRFNKATGETVRDKTNLAIAVRVERTGDAGGSGRAVDVLKDIVFEVLEELGYVEEVKNESYYDRRGITSGWGEEYINRGQYHKFKLEQ